MASQPFLDALKDRRSIYALTKESTISDARIQQLIHEIVLHVPSSFNSQSTRVVLLLKEEHDKFWEIAKGVVKAVAAEDAWPATEKKLNGFKGAYGTVLFFESRSAIASLEQRFPSYASRFATWAAQTSGMHQFALWTAFAAEGLGANLQHYNPLVDEQVAATWGIDRDWVLNAQLVFGKPGEGARPKEKEFQEVEGKRLLSFGV